MRYKLHTQYGANEKTHVMLCDTEDMHPKDGKKVLTFDDYRQARQICDELNHAYERGTGKTYDIWLVETELVTRPREDKLIESGGFTRTVAEEWIYFAHLDEPSGDRSEYWNYVAVPTGTQPEKYQRKSKYE